jgi:hypothetical protein
MLSAIDAEPRCFVQAKGRVFGPYTRAQLAAYATQGRLAPSSRVSQCVNSEWRAAPDVEALLDIVGTPQPSQARAANILVFAETNTLSSDTLETLLQDFGATAPIATGLWLLRTRHTAPAVRNALSQRMKAGDRLFVLDATRDKLAWFNLGPMSDARVREIWNIDLPEDVAT